MHKYETRVLKLRPHHIFCLPFLNLNDELDPNFFQLLMRIKQLLTSELDLDVTIIQGVDEICRTCPSCVGDRCESPSIKEEMVKKVDDFLLKDLGQCYGETLKVGRLQSLINENWPYRLCRACRWRAYCGAQVT